MFLHSGASLHGHEYSSPQPASQPPPRRFPFLRSALRTSSDTDPVTDQSSPVSAPVSPVEPRPNRPLSLNEPLRHSSLSTRRRTTSDVAPHTVRFREPQTDIATVPSEDEESFVGSELSDQTDASSNRRRRKRDPRKFTRFALAYPAPQLRTKQRTFVQIRPRVLLQLQELGEKRAIPAFDVVPSSLIAGSIIIPKLAKRFPRMFHAKPYLGQNDLLLVRSEDYGPSPSGSSRAAEGADNSSLDHKEVLAVVSTTAEQDDDRVEIVLQDGSVWVTSPMANGSYEFTHVDEQGQATKARWVKRAAASPRASWASASTMPTSPSGSPTPPEQKWTFSIISPSTRRHPIQGVLTSTALDIFDTYNTMSASSGRYPPSRSMGSDIGSIVVEESSLSNNSADERTTMAVTEEHKTLMLATAVWISLRQKGWPASATPKLPRVMSQCRSTSNGHSGRPHTFPLGCGSSSTATPPASSPHSRNVSQDTSATRHSNVGRLRRAVSSGSEFMRRRREASEMVEMEVDEKHNAKLQVEAEEKTHTCRFTIRRLTNKFFHHHQNSKFQGVS